MCAVLRGASLAAARPHEAIRARRAPAASGYPAGRGSAVAVTPTTDEKIDRAHTERDLYHP